MLSHPLIGWYFQSARPVTIVAAILAALFVLTYPERLATAIFFPLFFIIVHSVLTTRQMSRFDSPAAGFLYTRGFTRDRLWSHRVAAHLACILTVWGPATLIVWLGIRSAFQDRFLENPYYPLFRGADFTIPLWWLATYLMLLGAAQYGPIRRAHPTLDRDAGYVLELGMILVLLGFANSAWRGPWYFGAFVAAFGVASVALLLGSRWLHRQMEIRP
jgi:hypothetical protein